MAAYGRVKHSLKKARAVHRGSIKARSARRKITVDIAVSRTDWVDGKPYLATACVRKKNRMASDAGRCAGQHGTTPTKAVKKALTVLARSLR